MRKTRFSLLALCLAAVLLAVGAALETTRASAAGQSQTIAVLKSPNRDKARRTPRTIDQIVIHATEGHFWGSVRWLRNPRSGG